MAVMVTQLLKREPAVQLTTLSALHARIRALLRVFACWFQTWLVANPLKLSTTSSRKMIHRSVVLWTQPSAMHANPRLQQLNIATSHPRLTDVLRFLMLKLMMRSAVTCQWSGASHARREFPLRNIASSSQTLLGVQPLKNFSRPKRKSHAAPSQLPHASHAKRTFLLWPIVNYNLKLLAAKSCLRKTMLSLKFVAQLKSLPAKPAKTKFLLKTGASTNQSLLAVPRLQQKMTIRNKYAAMLLLSNVRHASQRLLSLNTVISFQRQKDA
jgi:hypothetical protein